MALGRLTIGVGAAIGVSLGGCGGGDDPTPAPSPAATPAPSPPWWNKCEKIDLPTKQPADTYPFPTPPTDEGYYGVPTDGIMTYNGVGDVNDIKNFLPECVSGFCDKNIGTKMPDKCCDPGAWKKDGKFPASWFGPQEFGRGGEDDRFQGGKEATCYVRDAPGPFNGGDNGVGGKNMQKIRNYLGCEAGKLYGRENCVPGGLGYITQAQYDLGKGTVKCDTEGSCPWEYPMSATVGLQHHVNGTGEQCDCSTQSYYTQGAGCYLAFATLAQYAGMYPAVFVRIGGDCSNSSEVEEQIAETMV
jgi:hypothetical protein